MKDLQGTTDPDTFSITSNRLLLIHVDHLELLNSSSSSRKKIPQNLSSPPLPSFPFSILSSQVLRPRPGRCGARRPLRRKAEEEREGAAAQVVSTLSCASPVSSAVCHPPKISTRSNSGLFTRQNIFHSASAKSSAQLHIAHFICHCPKISPAPVF